MVRNAVVGGMSLVLLGCMGGWGLAEEDSAAEILGRGVHAYNAGDLTQANSLLTQLIDKNSVDPRVYYFRGLALAGLGDRQAAIADFTRGADLEVNGEKKFNVSQSLERIQGQQRIDIEQQRAAARSAAAQKKKKRDQARYEQLQRRDDVVLYDPKRPAPDLSDVAVPPTPQPDPSDPFRSAMVLTGGKQVEVAAPPSMQTDVDPFAEDGKVPAGDPFAAESTKPADDDPFSAAKTPKPKTEAEDPFGGESPFGEDMPKAEEDPFADLPDAKPAGSSGGGSAVGSVFRLLGKTLSEQPADRNPFQDSKAGGEAETPEAPPAEQPAKKAEAADEDDPFK